MKEKVGGTQIRLVVQWLINWYHIFPIETCVGLIIYAQKHHNKICPGADEVAVVQCEWQESIEYCVVTMITISPTVVVAVCEEKKSFDSVI